MSKVTGEEQEAGAISEKTPVRLGVVITVIIFICTTILGSALYVAVGQAEMRVELRNVSDNLGKLINESKGTAIELSNHKEADNRMWSDILSRLGTIEKNGSQKAHDLEKDLNQLKIDFEVHKATIHTKGVP